jgi:thioredoxin-related protein
MKKLVTILAFILLTISILPAQDQIKWYTIEEADALLKTDPKPLFVDAYTDWCGWCKKLDQDTFSDPIIAAYMNKHFIPVKFNAESKEPVTFLGKEFINDGKLGKAHQLAAALMQGRMSYPTVIFLTEKGELLSPVPGYKTPEQIEPILVFFGEKKYLNEKWEDFSKNFEGSF